MFEEKLIYTSYMLGIVILFTVFVGFFCLMGLVLKLKKSKFYTILIYLIALQIGTLLHVYQLLFLEELKIILLIIEIIAIIYLSGIFLWEKDIAPNIIKFLIIITLICITITEIYFTFEIWYMKIFKLGFNFILIILTFYFVMNNLIQSRRKQYND